MTIESTAKKEKDLEAIITPSDVHGGINQINLNYAQIKKDKYRYLKAGLFVGGALLLTGAVYAAYACYQISRPFDLRAMDLSY